MSTLNTRRFYPNDIDLTSVISSNATESDLPGPGRIIGKLYANLGDRVEMIVNSLAERMNLGPTAVALRVKDREWKRYERGWVEEYTKKQEEQQRKDLEKLIRYTKSKTESTRRQALDSIVDLSLEGECLLDILKTSGASLIIKQQEPYIWDFCDASVQLSSRMALTCFQDEKLIRLLKSYERVHYSGEFVSFKEFLCENPDDSFLALRLFTRRLGRQVFVALEQVLEEMVDLALTSPELVEWEELDKIFKEWFSSRICSDDRLSRLLWYMFRFGEKLPRTAESWYWWLYEMEWPEDTDAHYYLAKTLEGCKAVEAYPEQALVCLPESVRRFLNPADLVLLHAALAWKTDVEYTDRFPLCAEDIIQGCGTLAARLDSNDEFMKQRAFQCSRIMLTHNAHSRLIMLNALSSTTFACTPEGIELLDSTERKCRATGCPITPSGRWAIRHCDERGRLVHLTHCDIVPRKYSGLLSCASSCWVSQSISLDHADIMWVEFPQGTPIRLPSTMVPIFAGRLQDERPAYVSVAYRDERYINYCAVVEGSKPEDLSVRPAWPPGRKSFKVLVPDMICVFILRYPSDTYRGLRRFLVPEDDKDVGLDATGPYGWKFHKYVSHMDQPND